ncbi:MAG: hypothetical protein E7321_01075 [Clostridiales bacterium]|nr:hypothetical protein [Clostridiales bacterium]
MKAYAAGLLAALMALMMVSTGALAQETMRIYVEEGALDKGDARRLAALLEEEFEDTLWTLMEEERPLRELVLAGDMPDLAICAPKTARPWAQEGLLLPLHARIGDQKRIRRQVLDLCVQDEELFMAPLIARHRQMAVNRRLFEAKGLSYMLDEQTYPMWYPAQFYQILEEFLMMDETAMDVWQPEPGTSAAIEALTQSIFGGRLLSEDGERCEIDGSGMQAGVSWLRDAIDDGMIGYCKTREEALERFIEGQTAIFIDWTAREAARQMQTIRERGLQIVTAPYPAAVGLPVRSFDLAGMCAFESGEASRDARLVSACALLHEQAQDVLGPQGIWQDGAMWPASLDRDDYTATLRSLFCEALQDVIEEGERVDAALGRAAAAMEALGRTK